MFAAYIIGVAEKSSIEQTPPAILSAIEQLENPCRGISALNSEQLKVITTKGAYSCPGGDNSSVHAECEFVMKQIQYIQNGEEGHAMFFPRSSNLALWFLTELAAVTGSQTDEKFRDMTVRLDRFEHSISTFREMAAALGVSKQRVDEIQPEINKFIAKAQSFDETLSALRSELSDLKVKYLGTGLKASFKGVYSRQATTYWWLAGVGAVLNLVFVALLLSWIYSTMQKPALPLNGLQFGLIATSKLAFLAISSIALFSLLSVTRGFVLSAMSVHHRLGVLEAMADIGEQEKLSSQLRADLIQQGAREIFKGAQVSSTIDSDPREILDILAKAKAIGAEVMPQPPRP